MNDQGNLFNPQTESSAVISPCGQYRYSLTRMWDEDKPGVLFIMLNPSTADASVNDPTIRRCLGYARSWGCGSLTVVNLFAFRATNPSGLIAYDRQSVVGPDNNTHIRKWIDLHREPGDYILAAWGAEASKPHLRWRRHEVMQFLPLAELYCLQVTKEGEPRHPLYCRADLGPVMFERDKPFAYPLPTPGYGVEVLHEEYGISAAGHTLDEWNEIDELAQNPLA